MSKALKNSLKNGFDALNVSVPLRLRSPSRAFVPPVEALNAEGFVAETMVVVPTQIGVETKVDVETLVSRITEVPALTPVAIVTEVVEVTQVDTQTQVVTNTRVDEMTKVSTATQVSPVTMVDPTTQVSEVTEVNAATKFPAENGAQKRSVQLERSSSPKLSNGYTRVPNSILMEVVSGDLHRSEIQLLLLIARFTISYGREFAPLSKAVIERQTKFNGPTVLKAIQSLVQKGLVKKITGDQHQPNQLGLVFDPGLNLVEVSTQVNAVTRVSVDAQVTRGTKVVPETSTQVAAATPTWVVAATYFKDSKTIKNYTPSITNGEDYVESYLRDLRPQGKAERERAAFASLKRQYSESEIETALQFLITSGMPADGSPCNFPLCFLATAIDQVLPKALEHKARQVAQCKRSELDREGERAREEQDAQDLLEAQEREAAFVRAFPDAAEQELVIARFVQNMPFITLGSPGARSIGILGWWGEREYPK